MTASTFANASNSRPTLPSIQAFDRSVLKMKHSSTEPEVYNETYARFLRERVSTHDTFHIPSSSSTCFFFNIRHKHVALLSFRAGPLSPRPRRPQLAFLTSFPHLLPLLP